MTTAQKPISNQRESESAKTEPAPVPAAAASEPFNSLRGEIDRLFEEATSGWPFRARAFHVKPWARLSSAPAADIVEKEGEFVMSLDIPGMDEKDVEVQLTDDAITVKGEKTEEKTEEKENYRLSERRRGSFSRSFALPDSVDADKVSATYEKGVLKLVMPKTEMAKKKQRKVQVKVA